MTYVNMSPRPIEMSFKKCGISNSLDESEGDFIRYSGYNYVSSADDDESNGEQNAVGT
jgi:hypothetical protein